MNIVVDADSCPFKEDLIKIASSFSLNVVMVLSVAHYYHESNEHVELIVVDNYSQAADTRIFNIVSQGDVVITGDWGLASLVLSKKASVISPRGYIFTDNNIELLLEKRHRDMKLRMGGHRTKGPSALTEEDREKFCNVLTEILSKK